MKVIKISLIIVLLIHFLSSMRYNLLGLEALKTATPEINRLNKLGTRVIYSQGIKTFDNAFIKGLTFYAVYTGTNRGYEFFSPNVSPSKIDLAFYSGNVPVELPLRRQESKIKLIAASYYLLRNIHDEKARGDLLKSISARLFTINPLMDSLNVYLNISQINYLDSIKAGEEYIKRYQIKAFVINRERK